MADNTLVRLMINGEEQRLPAATLDDVLRHFELSPKLVVAEVNGEIIPPDSYDMALKESDVIELVRFVGGG